MDQFEQPGFLFTVLMFVLMIGPLVFVHEMGHYLMGRFFGTKVESFSIGFGTQLAGWTDRRGTVWKLSALPLGGYVKFAGDANAAGAGSDGLEDVPDAERADYFAFKPIWQRALIVVAGPAINFLFAILIFAVFIGIYGQRLTPAVISQVLPDTPAALAGLQAGDRIAQIDGDDVARWEDLVQTVRINPDTRLNLTVERDGGLIDLPITTATLQEVDRFGNSYRIGRIGAGAAEMVFVERGPLESVWYATEEVYDLTISMAKTLGQLITGRRALDELGGPLKIAQISGQQASLGIASFVSLMALISVNLGFINLLPIPMLDGGHLALYAAEAVRGGKPLPEQAQQWAFMGGFALVVSFMVVVTFNDLASFGLWGHVLDLIG
ncbi:MAG: RIP metalloprotease RseP [Pacificimonas sp.]